MVDKTERLGFSYIWKIENFSYCLEKRNEPLASPPFLVDKLYNTEWQLLLYPRGTDDENSVAFYLQRGGSDRGPCGVTVDFELSFLAPDGTVLKMAELSQHSFERGDGYGIPVFVARDDVLRIEKSVYMPKDTLTARCRLWKCNSTLSEAGDCVARTRIGVERGSFSWTIRDFSKLQTKKEKTLVVERVSKRDPPLLITLFLSGGYQLDRKVEIGINQSDVSRVSFSTCKVSVLDVRGKALDSSEDEHWFEAKEGRQIWQLHPFMTKNNLMAKKNLYLPDDILSLRFEFGLSVGVELNELEDTTTRSPSPLQTLPKNLTHQLSLSRNCAVNLRSCPPLRSYTDISNTFVHDLHCMYDEELLYDFIFRAGAENFPVHKCILSARSPVFRAMFTNEMAESTTSELDIPDVNADTMNRLLTFIYTDSVEDISWEEASKLYFAADKYAIQVLKQRCAAILGGSLTVANVCHALMLSDMHQDNQLKGAALEFILHHDIEVFQSDEWKSLEGNDDTLRLALETMREVYMRKLHN